MRTARARPARIGRRPVIRLLACGALTLLALGIPHAEAVAARACAETASGSLAPPVAARAVQPAPDWGGDEEVAASAQIGATPEQVWRVLTDFDAWPEIFPDIDGVDVERIDSERVAVRKRGGGLGFDVEFTQLHTLRPVEGRIALELDRSQPSDIEELAGLWELRPIANGAGTHLVFRLRLDSGLPIPGFIERRAVARSMQRTVDAVVDEVARRCGRVQLAASDD